MSLLGPKVSVSPMGNERPGWDSYPISDMSFITLRLNGCNDEHFSRMITCCIPLMSEGENGVPSFNIWLFFQCNLVQFIIWVFHLLALWHLSNVDGLITGLWYCVALWSPISSFLLFCVPNLANINAANFLLTAFQLLQILQRAYLVCPTNDIAKLFTKSC